MRVTTRHILTGAALGLALTACKANTAPEVLILGDWQQSQTVVVSEQGVSFEISNMTLQYRSDGSSRSTSTLKMRNVPDTLATYSVSANGTWRITGIQLTEGVTAVKIKGRSGNPQAATIARQMETTIKAAEDTSTEILTLTETQMVLRQTGDVTIRFEKR